MSTLFYVLLTLLLLALCTFSSLLGVSLYRRSAGVPNKVSWHFHALITVMLLTGIICFVYIIVGTSVSPQAGPPAPGGVSLGFSIRIPPPPVGNGTE